MDLKKKCIFTKTRQACIRLSFGFVYAILVFNICYLSACDCEGITENESANELPFCRPETLPELSSHTLVISTLNGCITAFDASSGLLLWNHSTQPSLMLSSTINNFKFFSHGKSVQMIPSLDGELYTFNGEEMGKTPFSAENLLSSSIRMADDTLITGGKEIKLYGINKKTGQLHYSCGMDPCTYYSSSLNNDDILVVRHITRTVRALSAISGLEKWNYTVGQHEISIESPSGCYDKNSDAHGSQIDEKAEHELRLSIKFEPAEGYLTATSEIGTKHYTWSHKFDVPVVNAWRVHNQEVWPLNIFENNFYSSAADENDPISDKHMIYIGNYNKQLFILQPHSSIDTLDWRTFDKSPLIASPQVAWQPYLSTAISRTPIIHLRPPIDVSEVISVKSEVKNTAVMFGSNTGDYPFDSGLYLIIGQPINTSNLSLEIGGDSESLDQMLIVSLWYWWKEVLAISVTFAIVVNVLFTRHHLKHIRLKLLKETKETEDVVATATDSSQHTKESKSTESLESMGTPPAEFVSRYFSDFEPVQKLGKGGFGVVFEARNKIDDCRYAIKRIRMPNKWDSKERIMREVKALAKLDHAGIVRYYNSWLETPPTDWQKDMDDHYQDVGTPASGFTLDDLNTSFAESEFNEKGDNYTNDKMKYTLSFNNNWKKKLREDVKQDDLEKSSVHDSAALTTNDSVQFSELESELPKDRPMLKNMSSDSFIQFEDALVEDASEKSYTSKSATMNQTSQETDVIKPLKLNPFLQDNNPKSYLYIQMQLCRKESLKDWLKLKIVERDKFEVLDFFYQIVCAVEYVHQQGLIHRDLKPSNIFFALDGSIKIGDFGLVAAISTGEEEFQENATEANLKNQRHTNNVGTTLYMSPEQVAFINYDHKVDIFSLGLILFELLVPFSTDMERIKVMGEARNLKLPSHFTEKFADESELVKRMLSHNSKDRPCATVIKQNTLLQDFQPRPEFLRHQRSRSMSRTYSTSSSSSNSCGTNSSNGNNA